MSALNSSFDPLPELPNLFRSSRVVVFRRPGTKADRVDVGMPVDDEGQRRAPSIERALAASPGRVERPGGHTFRQNNERPSQTNQDGHSWPAGGHYTKVL
jgi:hypothetical protein